MDRIVKNKIILQFLSRGENVALSRITIAALASQLDLTLNDLEEIKVATSEAVSNAIIHGYQNDPDRIVKLTGMLYDDLLEIEVSDDGIGIKDVKEALQPAFSTDPDRMGLGFVFMQSFMDEVLVESEIDHGTIVTLRKRFSSSRTENEVVS